MVIYHLINIGPYTFLTAPSHYLSQCWLIINGIMWHLPKTSFTGSVGDTNLQKAFKRYTPIGYCKKGITPLLMHVFFALTHWLAKLLPHLTRGQWVKQRSFIIHIFLLCRWVSSVIKNNTFVTVNNDFWVTSEAICQWFSRVTKSRVKIIGKSHHEWPQIVIHGNECIILFLTRYFMSLEHTILLKTIIDRSFRICRQGRSFLTSHCDVTRVDLWRHANAVY